MPNKSKVMVIDDDKMIQSSISMVLRDDFDVVCSSTTEEALLMIEKESPKTILLDIQLSNENGMDFLPSLVKKYPYIPVIMLTGKSGLDYIKTSLNNGAYDFITKPYLAEDLISSIYRSIEESVDEHKNREFIGRSKAVQEINTLIKKAARSNCNVLIIGESGTGKEVVARLIHEQKNSSNYRPFVPINCGAIPENLIESTLFGHEAGAFTGAQKEQKGKFEIAHRGDLFLDEINSMPKEVQVRLLRVLQEKEFERVGGEKLIKSDFRVITATNVDITLPHNSDILREDLFYRISHLPIHIPPLRDRPEDIPLLINHFLQSKENNPEEKFISAELRGALTTYQWPGNVRQLFNTLRQILILSNKSELTLDDYPKTLKTMTFEDQISKIPLNHYKQAMDDYEKSWFIRAFNEQKNVSKVARTFDISRSTLYQRLKRLDIEYLLNR